MSNFQVHLSLLVLVTQFSEAMGKNKHNHKIFFKEKSMLEETTSFEKSRYKHKIFI